MRKYWLAIHTPYSDEDGFLIKLALETFLHSRCTAFTVFERSAVRFIMKQFMVPSTDTGKILLSSNISEGLAGVSACGPDLELEE